MIGILMLYNCMGPGEGRGDRRARARVHIQAYNFLIIIALSPHALLDVSNKSLDEIQCVQRRADFE